MTLHMNGDLKYECNEAIEEIIDKAYKRGYEDGENSYGTEIRTKQDVDEAYQHGYEDGRKAYMVDTIKQNDFSYQKGLEDAWECARKIAKEYIQMLKNLFGTVDISKIFLKYTVTEAMQKIKNYELTEQYYYEERQNIKEHKCEACDLFLKDCIGAVMLNGCDFYKDKESK